MRFSRKKLFVVALVASLLGAIYHMHSEYDLKLKGYSAHQISADPGLLDGATLRDGTYTNLRLTGRTFTDTKFKNLVLESPQFRDCTFRNVIFEEVDFKRAEFNNVIFENCRFANAKFSNITLRDILFNGGEMTYKGRYEYYYSQTYFHTANFTNVVFDGVKINYAAIEDATGSVLFKNMRQISIQPQAGLLSGNGLHVKIDNCALQGSSFVVSRGGSISIANSMLKDSGLIAKNGTLYMSNCQFDGGQLAAGTIVVEGSSINAPLLGGGEGKLWYIVGTRLLRNGSEPDVVTSFEPLPGTQVYIYGKNEPAYLYLDKANICIYDIELIDVYARDSTLQSLDLQNVTIRGGNWENVVLNGGQWENVQIYPTVDITGSTIENVQGYNVTFPEGSPWKGQSAGGASITLSKTPFEWPEVHVPTPEELGLVREWPEVTGAPKTARNQDRVRASHSRQPVNQPLRN